MKASTTNRAIIFRILMILYIFAVGYLCFNNYKDMPDDLPKMLLGIPIDKIAHFCMFLPFPILGFFAFDHERWTVMQTIGKILELAAYGCIFAGFTELVQSLLPYRTEDLADFKADAIAICLASLIVFIVDIFFIKHNKK